MQQPTRSMPSAKLRRITQLLLPLLLGFASSVALADPSANTGDVSVGVLESFGNPHYVLKIVDNTTRMPVTNTPVRIFSDNRMDWEGSTDAHGVLRIFGQIVHNSMHIFVSGYKAADFNRDVKVDERGELIIALDARVLAIEPVFVKPDTAKIRCYEQKEVGKLDSIGLPKKGLPKKPSDDWCGRSLCGCSTAVKLKCVTKVVSATPATFGQQPIYPTNLFPEPNVKISCGEKELAVSDREGYVAFTLNTSTSPACGTECSTLIFTKERPTSYETWKVDIDFGGWTVLGQAYHQKAERTNGKNNGKWEEWCSTRQGGPTDKLKVSGQFRNGLKDGEWTEWHCLESGMKSQGFYKEGKREAVWKEWYANGQISHQSEWHDDKLHGMSLSWYSYGEVESEQEFREGKPVGVGKYTPWKWQQ